MEFNKASAFKRICAAIMDIFLLFLFTSIISSFVCLPIAKGVSEYNARYEAYESELFDLGYYVFVKEEKEENENNYKYVIVATYENDENQIENAKKDENNFYVELSNSRLSIDNAVYEKHINHFLTEIGDTNTFNNAKKNNSSLYEEKDNEYVLKSDVKSEDLKEFYNSVYENLLNNDKLKTYKDGSVINNRNYYSSIKTVCVMIPFFVSLIVFYLVLPLVTKNGQTLGKKMMVLGVVNVKDGSNANKLSLIIRFMAFSVIELLLSLIFSFLPLIISVFVMIFNKKGQSIHDLLAQTTVVDLYNLKINSSAEEAIEVESKVVEEDISENTDNKAE